MWALLSCHFLIKHRVGRFFWGILGEIGYIDKVLNLDYKNFQNF